MELRYAYQRDFLMRFLGVQTSSLEQIKKMEQSRFLQSGCRIQIGIVSESHRGIDTREDYESFKMRWREKMS